jgi:glycosidase
MSKPEDLVVDPPYWWSGMKNPVLQLLLRSKGISAFTPSIASGSTVIERHVTFTSPNYLAIYMNLSHSPPGSIEIRFASPAGEFQLSYELKARVPPPFPQSFSSADVLYLIMPDRFARGNPSSDPIPTKYPYTVDRTNPNVRHGGDLLGIKAHLQYLHDLGVTAVWPTPIFENDVDGGSYHGYTISDFYKVDPRYGTNDEFFAVVKEAASLDLKFVIDLIFNHCSSTHPFFLDPPSRDWFHSPDKFFRTNYEVSVSFNPYASKIDILKLNEGAFDTAMPDLNQQNADLARYLTQVPIWWIEASGIAGIRMDTWPYCDDDMMNQWILDVNAEYPDFNIVGEAWAHSTIGCAYFQRGCPYNPKTQLRTVMDFEFSRNIRAFVTEESSESAGAIVKTGMASLYEHFALDFCYPNIFAVMRFLDNHDTDRFLQVPPTDLTPLKHAITVLLTAPGIPQIFYGTEVLANGVRKVTDGYVRKDFPGGWKDDPADCFTREGRSALQNEAWDFISKLLNWRKGNEVIARGSMVEFKPLEGVLVYERRLGEVNVIVMLSGMNEKVVLDLKTFEEVIRGKVEWTDVITGRKVQLGEQLVVEPREVLVLV